MSTIRNANANAEFWRPPVEELNRNVELASRSAVCASCQSEFVMGARYCHVCGMERNPRPRSGGFDWSIVRKYLRLSIVSDALGVNVASLLALFAGLICVIGALSIGAFYQVETVADWQAIQVWRIEWLLAAILCVLTGMLLRRRRSAD